VVVVLIDRAKSIQRLALIVAHDIDLSGGFQDLEGSIHSREPDAYTALLQHAV